MIQHQFVKRATEVIKKDDSIIGLAIGGSWLTNEVDEYSDLDLTLITKEKVSDHPAKMLQYAAGFGKLLSGFTGEHVGEPRLLICLYDDPLLHVDIKFLTLPEFYSRVENPVILHDTSGQLKDILSKTESQYPFPGYQWIEDRFWIWVHYATLKIGRGELFEALDFLGFIRMVALGPLLQAKNGDLPRGVRKVEMNLPADDLKKLKLTIAAYEQTSIIAALQASIELYRYLRQYLFSDEIKMQAETELKVVEYLQLIKAGD
ncbi:MAG: nucleotidyltransferase domain-containing protein [Chitinophagaceae bacterium]